MYIDGHAIKTRICPNLVSLTLPEKREACSIYRLSVDKVFKVNYVFGYLAAG